ncbi:MAG: hypothetical protein AAGI70_05975, partial [Pseudomonadota bacterium]
MSEIVAPPIGGGIGPALDPGLEDLRDELDAIAGISASFDLENDLLIAIDGSDSLDLDLAIAAGLGVEARALLENGTEIDAAVLTTYDLNFIGNTESYTAAIDMAATDMDPLVSLAFDGAADLTGALGLAGLPLEIVGSGSAANLDLDFTLDVTSDGLVANLVDGGTANLSAVLETAVPDGGLPQIATDLNVDFGLTAGRIAGGFFDAPTLQLSDLALETNNLTGFLNDAILQITAILETFPLGQIIDFLASPVPIIDDLGGFGIPDV